MRHRNYHLSSSLWDPILDKIEAGEIDKWDWEAGGSERKKDVSISNSTFKQNI